MPDTDTPRPRADRRARRWRRTNGLLSAGVGALAVGVAVVIGVTGPTSSPVAPAAAPAAVAAAPTSPDLPSTVDHGHHGDGRLRMVGFDRHHR